MKNYGSGGAEPDDDEFFEDNHQPAQQSNNINLPLTDPVSNLRMFFSLILTHGACIEVRVFDKSGNVAAGYFDSADAAVNAVQKIPPGVFINATMNPVPLDFLARGRNVMRGNWKMVKAGIADEEVFPLRTITDDDIATERLFVIDVDPERHPKDISSTDSELAAARNVADNVRSFLRERGIDSLLACSGNGWHIHILLPQAPFDEARNQLRIAVLNFISEKFSTAAAKIDTCIANPSRVIKCIGTVACKGDNVPEIGRVWRQSHFEDFHELQESANFYPTMQPILAEKIETEAPSQQPVQSRDATGISIVDQYIESAPPAVSGQNGHGTTFKVACHLARMGLTGDDLIAAMKKYNLKCSPQWSDTELRHKANDAENAIGSSPSPYGEQTPRVALSDGEEIVAGPVDNPIAAAKAGSPWPMTDAGNAERLAYYTRGKLIFDERIERWRYFDGKKWKIDNVRGKHIHRAAIRAARKIRNDEARQCQNTEDGRDIEKQLCSHSVGSESRNKLEAMIALAQHVPGMSRSEFDADKYLFNCQNGTIELKTGTLREHRADDYITRISPVAYDPNADCSAWTKFLDETLQGDQEMLLFIKKSTGYCLSGDTSEEILFLVHGPAATGKSTFMEAVKSAIGDYSKTCDFETFLKQKDSGRPRNDIAGLAGARLVSSCEVEEGKALAENIIKNVTGGDTISARFLFKEFFEYEPQFKLWLICNHAPKVDPQDGAMWRRILRIPFILIVPKEKRDKRLKTMLKDPAIGGVQILKWAVEGFLLWQAEGLQIPETVVQATEEYRKSCDYLADFFSEVCDLSDPQAWMSTAQLFDAYKKYCDANEIKHTMNMVSFSRKLEARGLKQQKQGGSRGWQGICPASKMPVLDRLDTSFPKSPIELPRIGLCKTSVQSVLSVQPPLVSSQNGPSFNPPPMAFVALPPSPPNVVLPVSTPGNADEDFGIAGPGFEF